MADLSDVEKAIVSSVTTALYPQGTIETSAVGSVCRIYRGWPQPAALNADLTAGIVNVTILPSATPGEVVDSYFDRLYAPVSSSTLLSTVSGQHIVFSGQVAGNEIIGLLIDKEPVSYIVKPGDTCQSIAADLGVLINLRHIAISQGSTLTITDSTTVSARIVTNTTVSRSLRRQRREFQIVCWCSSPALRDSVAAVVDVALSASTFLDLADQTKAHIRYVSTMVHDQSQNAQLYRRDLLFECEYTIIAMDVAPVMLFGRISNAGGTLFS